MTSNGKQFTVTREMLTAVAGISARFSKFAFVLFCYITNHLMTGPLGNSEFCFPRISMFPWTSSRETLRFSGNKIHCSPRDQSLSVNYLPVTGSSGIPTQGAKYRETKSYIVPQLSTQPFDSVPCRVTITPRTTPDE